MVAEDVHRPAVRGVALDYSNLLPKLVGIQFGDLSEVEVHGHLQFVVMRAVVLGELLRSLRPGLTDQNASRKLIGDSAQLLQLGVYFTRTMVVDVFLNGHSVCVGTRERRVVGEIWIFEEGVDGIEAEAVHTAAV